MPGAARCGADQRHPRPPTSIRASRVAAADQGAPNQRTVVAILKRLPALSTLFAHERRKIAGLDASG